MALNRAKFHLNNEYKQQSLSLGPYLLVQAGDLKCEPGYVIEPHEQWVAEISLVVSGEACFEVNGKRYDVHKGMLFLNGNRELHAIRSSITDPLRMMYMGFDFADPLPDYLLPTRAFFCDPDIRMAPFTLQMQQAFIRLIGEILAPDALSDAMMLSCMHQIICTAYRLCHSPRRYEYHYNNSGAQDDKLAYDVLHYLDAHPELSRLGVLSSEFGYSYAHIANRFSLLTGESLMAYHTRQRMDQAKVDLAAGRSITEIAERLGYRSIHAFSRAFKAYIGTNPREYLRAAQAGGESTRQDKGI